MLGGRVDSSGEEGRNRKGLSGERGEVKVVVETITNGDLDQWTSISCELLRVAVARKKKERTSTPGTVAKIVRDNNINILCILSE